MTSAASSFPHPARFRGLSVISCAFAFAMAACAAPSEAPPAPAPAAPAEPAESAEPAAPTPDPNAEACAAQSAALQKGLDGAHRKTTDVVLALKDETCGLRVLTSGPSKLDDTKLHRIGSVTKTYVAAVILSLANEGALALDDALSKWVDGVPDGETITVRQLLNHSSGLFNYTDDKDFQSLATTKAWTPRELVDVAIANEPYFEPGKSWHYSNTNYVLLGMIAEKAGNAKIGALVRQRVFEKAGLAATFFDGEETITGELATGKGAGGTDMTHIADPSWAWAAGAMVASPSDVVRWIERIGSGTFYDPATQTELLTPVPTDDSNIGYGLGIMLFGRAITGGGGPAIGHGGDIPGYHTQAFYFPEKKTTIVSIVDSDTESPNDVSLVAIEALFAKAKKTAAP